MKGRQQEGVPIIPTSTQQSNSATESGDLTTNLSGEHQSLEAGNTASKPQKKRVQPNKQKPICRFYVSSSCKYGDHCKFYHPKPSFQSQSRPSNKSEENDDKRSASRRTPSDLNLGMFMKPVKSRPPVRRPEPVNRTPADLLQVSVWVWVSSQCHSICVCMCGYMAGDVLMLTLLIVNNLLYSTFLINNQTSKLIM